MGGGGGGGAGNPSHVSCINVKKSHVSYKREKLQISSLVYKVSRKS